MWAVVQITGEVLAITGRRCLLPQPISPILTVTVPHVSGKGQVDSKAYEGPRNKVVPPTTSTVSQWVTKQVCEGLEMYKEQPLGLCLKHRQVGGTDFVFKSTSPLSTSLSDTVSLRQGTDTGHVRTNCTDAQEEHNQKGR